MKGRPRHYNLKRVPVIFEHSRLPKETPAFFEGPDDTTDSAFGSIAAAVSPRTGTISTAAASPS
jgi:hypothetical protein